MRGAPVRWLGFGLGLGRGGGGVVHASEAHILVFHPEVAEFDGLAGEGRANDLLPEVVSTVVLEHACGQTLPADSRC